MKEVKKENWKYLLVFFHEGIVHWCRKLLQPKIRSWRLGHAWLFNEQSRGGKSSVAAF